MKKGCLPMLKYASLDHQPKKEDHSSYFQSLEQKLLYQSDKISNLIGKPASNSDSHSIRGSQNGSSRLRPSISEKDEDDFGDERDVSHSSIILQNYLLKKNQLTSSRSQYFNLPKEKQSQIQRKLTYNMVKPPEQTNSQHSFIMPVQHSPCKSQKINDHLKKTASTTSSAVLKTIDRIKKLQNLGARSSFNTLSPPKSRGPSIQDFEILKYLQQGQFGAVYLAVNRQSNFICALKKIPKRIFEGQARFINQLVREVKIQSYLDHPNIVQLYAFFCDQQFLYLILEPCLGGNVYASLKKDGRFGQQRVRNMVRQVSHAIQFMHDSDIIHRDIKPQNILLHQGIVKVCDFGWSIHSPLLRDTRCGTPLYSSPQVVQKQQYDNKVDVWNIGIFTYQLLYGRVPFQIRTEDDLVKVVDDDIYFPKGVMVSKAAQDFILKCLHKNPKDRLSMAKLVDHPFILP